jgi:hypothetical protein
VSSGERAPGNVRAALIGAFALGLPPTALLALFGLRRKARASA